MKRPLININPVERAGRVLMGLLGVIGGVVLLAGSGGMLTAVLAVLFALAGLMLVVTGALGYCPLYHDELGDKPASLRKTA